MSSDKQKPHPSGKVVAVRLDPVSIERLDKLAERTGRNRGSYLRTAIRAMLPILERMHWEETMIQVEEDQIAREFREMTWQLIDQEDYLKRGHGRREWGNPEENEG